MIGGSAVVIAGNIMSSSGTGRRGVSVARTRLESTGECLNLAEVASEEKSSIDDTKASVRYHPFRIQWLRRSD